MVRDILAGVIGIAVAILIVFLAHQLNVMLFPPPIGLDLNDPDALQPYVATLPISAFVLVLVGPMVGTFIGATIACRIGTAKPMLYPAIIATLFLAFTVSNLIAIPHPLWFAIAAIITIALSAWLAWQLELKVREKSAARGAV